MHLLLLQLWELHTRGDGAGRRRPGSSELHADARRRAALGQRVRLRHHREPDGSQVPLQRADQLGAGHVGEPISGQRRVLQRRELRVHDDTLVEDQGRGKEGHDSFSSNLAKHFRCWCWIYVHRVSQVRYFYRIAWQCGSHRHCVGWIWLYSCWLLCLAPPAS